MWQTLIVEFWRTLIVEFWQTLIDNSGVAIAVFTGILAITTIVYVVVSTKLLKQSKNALLADIFIRVTRAFRKDLFGMKKEQVKGEVAFIRAWLEGCHKAFIEIDKKLGMDIQKLFDVFLETTMNEFFKIGESMGEEYEKAKKEVDKLRWLIEKEEQNKGSGTSSKSEEEKAQVEADKANRKKVKGRRKV